MTIKKFKEIFENNLSRVSTKWQHYFDVYDRHLQKFIDKDPTILEIGVSGGGSLQIWKNYFGKNSKIVGIDINSYCFFREPQIEVYIGDQTDKNFLCDVLTKIGTPDIIIDDGSHKQTHILNTFEILYPKLSNNGGVYIIEDTHTAYWPEYEGGLSSCLNVVDIFSNQVHSVNTKWLDKNLTSKLSNLDSIHFYDSLIVLEKRDENYFRYSTRSNSNGVKITRKV